MYCQSFSFSLVLSFGLSTYLWDDMYTYLSSNVTQWKVANSNLFAILQAPIGLD